MAKWNVTTALQTLMTTELDDLGNGTLVVSSTSNGNQTSGLYDNSTALDLFADFELQICYATAPAAGIKVAELYILPKTDGTNLASVDGNNQPQKSMLIATFESRLPSTSVAEYLIALGVPLPPGKWKWVLKNTAGQTLKSSSVSKSLKMQPYQTA